MLRQQATMNRSRRRSLASPPRYASLGVASVQFIPSLSVRAAYSFARPFSSAVLRIGATPSGVAVPSSASASPALMGSPAGGVAATSGCKAWAVGWYIRGGRTHTLIEFWNGKAWKVQPSPSLGSDSSLSDVGATSSTNAWAVGSYNNGTAQQPQTTE